MVARLVICAGSLQSPLLLRRCRKKGCFGHYKKTIFCPLKKHGFFAVFANRLKTLVWLNEYKCFVNRAFSIFVPKWVKKSVKINIVSNLP
jgi:hypothetical protein